MIFARKKIIFDTSTLISACIYPDRTLARIFQQALIKYQLVVSRETLEELTTVLARPKFDTWRSMEQRKEWIKRYAKAVVVFPITINVTDCRDPKDNKFLDLALSAEANIVVVSDDDLLTLNPYNDVEIIGVIEFRDKYLNSY
jgi:uncharacterized protein